MTETYGFIGVGNNYDTGFSAPTFNVLQKSTQAFFVPSQSQVFDLVNNEVINYKGDGNNLKLVDSWGYDTSTVSSVPAKVNFSVSNLTDVTIAAWVKYSGTYTSSTSIFGFAGMFCQPNLNGSLTIFGGNIIQTDTISSILITGWNRIVLIKTVGHQKLFVNGIKAIDSSSNAGNINGTVTFNIGNRINKFKALYSDVQLWKVSWSDSDALYDYQNKYNLVTDNISCSFAGSYNLVNDVLYLWWKLSEGNNVSQTLDASGNGNISNSTPSVSGWSAANDFLHWNLIKGCSYEQSAHVYYPFNFSGTPTLVYDNYLSGTGTYSHYYQDGKSFLPIETKLQQKNNNQPDYNNFWYDINGIKNKKTFSDFLENNGGQLFSDIHYVDKINHILSFKTQQQNISKIETFINKGLKDSKNIFVYGDSMPGGLSLLINTVERNKYNSSRCSVISNTGGEHSYMLIQGKLVKSSDPNNTKLPEDIATQYPSNPNNLYTGYDTVVVGQIPTFISTRSYYKHFIQLQWMGTNNPTNTYSGTPDFGLQHYRLIPDILKGLSLGNNTAKKSIVIAQGNMLAPSPSLFDSIALSYQTECTRLNIGFINPKELGTQVFNELYQNKIDLDVIQKLIEIDINNQAIINVNGQYYVYNPQCPRTNTLGQPLDSSGNVIGQGSPQGTIAKWVRLDCSTPNTIVTIRGTQYDVFNPCLLSTSITGSPFLQDFYPSSTWPSILHRDNIHPNDPMYWFIVAKIYLILQQNNW